jgi:hypothetical protein
MIEMGNRRIRLDEESERLLKELATEMGVPISEVLRQGLVALRSKRRVGTTRPFDIYQQLELGPGGYALASSTEIRRGVREALRRERHTY